VPAGLASHFTAAHVVVEAPVKDPNGKLVGVAQIGFSTAREETLIADIERRVLLLSTGAALGLMLILSLASRAVVVRPLQRLTQATAALKRGDKVDLTVTSRDEIGELMQAFMAMSAAIETREQRIRDRNRDMLRILDNAEDGFITVSRAGIMNDERSKILERWFGPAEGPSFLAYFSRICPERGEAMQLAWDALVDDVLPVDLLIDQMPKTFVRDGRHFQLRYRTISGASGSFESLLVVIHDATEAVERDRAEVAQKEMLAIFRRLMTDPGGWREFFESGSRMVALLCGAPPPDDVTARRLVHTLKGNCAVMGLESMARLMHDLEGRETAGAAILGAEDVRELAQRWGELGAISARLGGASAPGEKDATERPITISAMEYDDLLLALERGGDQAALVRRVASWRDEAISARFERVRNQIEVLSRKLGRGEPDVTIDGPTLRVSTESFADLWTVLAHVVRNAVDHGFETAEERAAAGKSPRNRVWLKAIAKGDLGFVISIGDDGRGIDWRKLAEKAAAAGLPTATRADLEEALYTDSISTRDHASETSGRGVGLAAVRSVVRSLGGSIEIESTPGQGTTFRFALPWPPPRSRSNFLAPVGQPGGLPAGEALRSPSPPNVRSGPARDHNASDDRAGAVNPGDRSV
jgi:two-component system chemotaxis sensor kinase CheA